MTAHDPAPVVIAGAGPVGLALAVGLAHHGVRSVVLEESEGISEHSKAAGIVPRTLEIFAGWNLLEQFVARGVFLRQPRIWTPGRDEPIFTVDFGALEATTVAPGLLILPQNRTEAILRDTATASALVDLRFGHRVTDFGDDGTGVTVTAERAGGDRIELRSAYLVGCDGPRSTLREKLGFSLEGKTYPARMLLADVRIDDRRDALPWPRLVGRTRGGAGAIRIEERLWRLIATLDASATDERATSTAYVASLVDELLGPGPFETVWASPFRIHCRTSPHFQRGRVFLAGDAAHINSPAGGQGMNSGVQDAHNLAWKLARAVGTGHADALLDSYEAERRPVILTNVDRYTDLLTRGLLLAPRPVRFGVFGLARLATMLPPVRTSIMRRAGMLDTKYAGSPIISGRGALLGARSPNTRVLRNTQPVRLHELAARDPLLLLFDDGRLPRWSADEVAHQVRAVRGLRVARVVQSGHDAEPADLVDAEGATWREWDPGPGTAALLRPDGHVGWLAERPTAAELTAGVVRALGDLGA